MLILGECLEPESTLLSIAPKAISMFMESEEVSDARHTRISRVIFARGECVVYIVVHMLVYYH